jgi:hypothetical protein
MVSVAYGIVTYKTQVCQTGKQSYSFDGGSGLPVVLIVCFSIIGFLVLASIMIFKFRALILLLLVRGEQKYTKQYGAHLVILFGLRQIIEFSQWIIGTIKLEISSLFWKEFERLGIARRRCRTGYRRR